jgi:hypothetical protein
MPFSRSFLNQFVAQTALFVVVFCHWLKAYFSLKTPFFNRKQSFRDSLGKLKLNLLL